MVIQLFLFAGIVSLGRLYRQNINKADRGDRGASLNRVDEAINVYPQSLTANLLTRDRWDRWDKWDKWEIPIKQSVTHQAKRYHLSYQRAE